MDEASVEEAIKDKLLVDERLLKRLVKASLASKTDNNNSSVAPVTLEEFQAHAEKIQTYTTAAKADITYFEQETLLLTQEHDQLQSQIANMRISLQAEREQVPQFEELQKLHLKLKEFGEHADLLALVQREEAEVQKLKEQIAEEEEKLKLLKSKLECFLAQFRSSVYSKEDDCSTKFDENIIEANFAEEDYPEEDMKE